MQNKVKNLLIATFIFTMAFTGIGDLTAGMAISSVTLPSSDATLEPVITNSGTNTVNGQNDKHDKLKTIIIYNSGGQESWRWNTEEVIHHYCVSGDGSRVALNCGGQFETSWDENVKIIGADPNEKGTRGHLLSEHMNGSVHGLTLNNDGRYLAVIYGGRYGVNQPSHKVDVIQSNDNGGQGNTVIAFDNTNDPNYHATINMIDLSGGDVKNPASYIPHLAVVDNDDNLKVLTPVKGCPDNPSVLFNTNFGEKIHGISLSNDGNRIAVWAGNRISVIDINTKMGICSIIRNDISSVAISGDGKRVGYTYNNATAEIMDCDRRQKIEMSDWLNSVVPINCIIKPFYIALDETGDNLYLYRNCNAIATYSVPASSSR